MPCSPPIVIAALLPITWAETMVSISHWVGLTLPGMIELPGSFAGRSSSPMPERGPEPSSRMSFAILVSATARVLSVPERWTIGSFDASASNLFSAVKNGRPVRSESCAAIASPKSLGALSPVPTAVPPWASWHMPCTTPG